MKGRTDPLDSYTAPTSTPSFTPDNRDECAFISFHEKLKKIQPAFHSVKIGDELDIRIDGVNILTVHKGSTVYGNIVSSFNGSVVKCKRNGRAFKVKVLSKAGDIQVYCI
jgi:hypothetical protein